MDLVQPLLDDSTWDSTTLRRALECYTCSIQVYNHWLVCIRKCSAVNLHPSYTSRRRQWWFVAMLPVKYLIIPPDYLGSVFKFEGVFSPRILNMTSNDPAVPIKLRDTKAILYGESVFICISLRGKNLW